MAPLWSKPGEDTKYESLRTSESESDGASSEKHLLEHEEDIPIHPMRTRRSSSCWASRSVLFAITFLNLVFLVWSTWMATIAWRQDKGLNADLKKISAWSPILDEIEVPVIDKKVEGHLFPRNDGTDLLGRMEPGKKADDAWEDYEIQRPFAISAEQVRKLGKDPAKTVKYPDDFGLGDDAYMAGMDVFHQLHCFDSIRKEAFKDYYWDGERYRSEMYTSTPRREHSELWWIHMRHCVDIITQSIICHADTEMTTMTWLETQERPWPDFSINRKCRDFEQLVKWRDENAQDIARSGTLKKPHDQTKIQDMYWRLFGNDTHEGDNRHHPVWD